MNDSTQDTIGGRIKAARSERGITQENLAERAGVSVDVIRKLEQQQRKWPKASTLGKIANALGMPTSELLGRRERLDKAAPEGILPVRDALLSVSDLPGMGISADDGEPAPVSALEEAVRAGWGAYWDGRLADLAAQLPGLIAGARLSRGHAGAPAAKPLAQSYQLAAYLMVHVGADDLAAVAAERALSAAHDGDDELQYAALAGTYSWVLLHQSRLTDAERVAARAAEQIEVPMSKATPEHLTVWGSLLLAAAAPAATASRPDDVDQYLGLARAAAGRFEQDRHDYWTSFGPVQVSMQDTYTSAMLGRVGRALTAAQGVHRDDLLHISWGAHKLDVAQALTAAGRTTDAVEALQEAWSVSDEWFRHQGAARNLVRDLLERQRRLTPALRKLAVSVGVN